MNPARADLMLRPLLLAAAAAAIAGFSATAYSAPPAPITSAGAATEVTPSAPVDAPALKPVSMARPRNKLSVPANPLSNRSLEADINAAATPASRNAIRIADRARRELLARQPDAAIRILLPALSIDVGNPFIYFYLGRAYMMKRDYHLSLVYWQRASAGFVHNAVWLSEVTCFEGWVHMETGDSAAAREDFERAYKLDPDNEFAREGSASFGPEHQEGSASYGSEQTEPPRTEPTLGHEPGTQTEPVEAAPAAPPLGGETTPAEESPPPSENEPPAEAAPAPEAPSYEAPPYEPPASSEPPAASEPE